MVSKFASGSSTPPKGVRRRLSVDDRLSELTDACLDLVGSRPWDEVSMADVAAAAGVSKPLLYHYFSTKSALYLATVRSAAEDLRAATLPDLSLPPGPRTVAALRAHLDWIEDHASAYRAILQGGISSDIGVQAIVETSRADVVDRLAETFALAHPTPAQRIALRGWVGFLEAACLDWLADPAITKDHLARILAASVPGIVEAADVDPRATDGAKI